MPDHKIRQHGFPYISARQFTATDRIFVGFSTANNKRLRPVLAQNPTIYRIPASRRKTGDLRERLSCSEGRQKGNERATKGQRKTASLKIAGGNW
jgi:hypothetical protein